jgi:hypothetical protein
MIVAEQVSLPFEKSRAAQGALVAWPPPMIWVLGGGASWSGGAGAAVADGAKSERTQAAAAATAGMSRDMRMMPRFARHAG